MNPHRPRRNAAQLRESYSETVDTLKRNFEQLEVAVHSSTQISASSPSPPRGSRTIPRAIQSIAAWVESFAQVRSRANQTLGNLTERGQRILQAVTV